MYKPHPNPCRRVLKAAVLHQIAIEVRVNKSSMTAVGLRMERTETFSHKQCIVLCPSSKQKFFTPTIKRIRAAVATVW